MNRFERQVAFFGETGQIKLQSVKVAVIGVGGIGSHVVQQLAFLGVQNLAIIDDDELSISNANRLVGYLFNDKEGTPKVDIAERTIKQIDPSINVTKVKNVINSKEALEASLRSDFVFGCIDNDGARLFINEFCLAYKKPFIDAASEIKEDNIGFGGRVISVIDEPGCLYCLNEISQKEAAKYLSSPEARRDQKMLYGLNATEFQNSGPSVVTLNGIIASLATTEFMVYITGQRPINKKITYYGKTGLIRKSIDLPPEDCYYCNMIKGSRDKANLQRFFA